MVQDYMIHRFIREQGGKATKQQISMVIGSGIGLDDHKMREGQIKHP